MKTAALNSYTNLELALMILLGYYGNGDARKKALGSRYTACQGIVEKILKTQSVPSGSVVSIENQRDTVIKKAVKAVLQNEIDELAEEIINEIK